MDDDVIGVLTQEDAFGRKRRVVITYDVKDRTPQSGVPQDILDPAFYDHPFKTFLYETFKGDMKPKTIPEVTLPDSTFEDCSATLQELAERKRKEAEKIEEELKNLKDNSPEKKRVLSYEADIISNYFISEVEKRGSVDIDFEIRAKKWSYLATEEAIINILARDARMRRSFSNGGQLLERVS